MNTISSFLSIPSVSTSYTPSMSSITYTRRIYLLTYYQLTFCISMTGLFELCHDYVDPAIYYETCVYDVCSQESPAFLCSNMERYAQSCILKGVDISHWWIDRPECEPGDSIISYRKIPLK